MSDVTASRSTAVVQSPGIAEKPRSGKVEYYCQCKFSEPLSRALRCEGCHWQYHKKDLPLLRKNLLDGG